VSPAQIAAARHACLLTGHPEHLGGDRPTRRVPLVARKQPARGLLLQSSPIGAQLIEQGRAQHDITVLASPDAAGDVKRRSRSRPDQRGTDGPAAHIYPIAAGTVRHQDDWLSLRGKVVVLEFWATWCGACIEQIPHLNSIVRSVGSGKVQVYRGR
jgi:thiol-disulfide isomerase/thioredoxin